MAKRNSNAFSDLYSLGFTVTFFYNYVTVGNDIAHDSATTLIQALWWFFFYGPLTSTFWALVWPIYWMAQIVQ